MSYVITAPETLTAVASDLDGLGSTIREANAAAAIPTTGLLPAAADEVSTQVAKLFGAHAQQFHAVSAQAAAFHAEFVQALKAGAGSYVATEAANASPLQTVEQDLLNAVKAPAQPLLGPLLSGGSAGAGTGGFAPLFRAAPSAPEQQFPVSGPMKLFTNTFQNVEAVLAAHQANPFPVLSQLRANQIGYSQLLGTAFQTIGQNLMTFGQGLPAVFQTSFGFLQQGDIFDAMTYLWNQTVVTPLIDDVGFPLLEALSPILQDVGTHTSNLLSSGALLYLALAPLPPPNAAVYAMAGVSQDVVNALGSGNYLTALKDISLMPTTVLDASLNGYPVSGTFLDPSAGLLTGVPGSTQPSSGDGTAGILLVLGQTLATALGAG